MRCSDRTAKGIAMPVGRSRLQGIRTGGHALFAYQEMLDI
jgi:hypothetical protein